MHRFCLYLLLFSLVACQGQTSRQTVTSSKEPYTFGPKSYDGTGKYYMRREISEVMGHQGAAWLEREERQQEERTDLVLANLELSSDDHVADIGAGSGYYSFRIADQVPEGKVYAVDIQPEMLAMIQEKIDATGMTQVAPVKGTITDPNLLEAQLDLVFMVDVYHEFSHPYEMMTQLVKALKPGGRVILLEYRAEDPKVPIKPRHKMTADQARREMKAVGLTFLENRDMLPWQHFLIFQKPFE